MDGNNQNQIDEDDDFEDFPVDGNYFSLLKINLYTIYYNF